MMNDAFILWAWQKTPVSSILKAAHPRHVILDLSKRFSGFSIEDLNISTFIG